MTENKQLAGNLSQYREIVAVPWGIIPERFVSTPQSSRLAENVPRTMRAPVRIRVNPWGELGILAYPPNSAPQTSSTVTLFRFSSTGDLIAQLTFHAPFSNKTGWRILDYVTEQSGNLYLLETFLDQTGTYNQLRKISLEGHVVWSHSGRYGADLRLDYLDGDFQQLLIDQNAQPYLSASRHRGLVAGINPDNGDLMPYADWGTWTGEVFMDGKGRIHYVRYLPESRQRAWTVYDPQTRQEYQTPCDERLYGLLAMPL